MSTRSIRALGAVLVGGLLLAACSNRVGGGGNKTVTSSPPTVRDTTRGVTDNQIMVGGLAPLTSARAATLPGSDIGAQAYFSRVNAAGGIFGRKINFIGVTDDGDNPSTNL